MVFSLFWRRLGSQNHPQHKPDLTWNGKRRSFEKIAMAALKSDYLRSILLRASIWKPLGSRAPLASLAALARSLAALASHWCSIDFTGSWKSLGVSALA